MTIDVSSIRARFPALARERDGRPFVFADAPGGTQVPREVIDAMARYLEQSNANAGGAFATSRETDRVIVEARRAAADLLGCEPEEIVFGPNTTTLAFGFSRAIARGLRPGDEIVVTHLDHDANIAPWLAVAEDTGATLRWVDIRDEDCALDLDSLEAVVGERTRVVAFTLASNAVGTITDAPEIVRRVRARSAALLVADGVHLAPHRALDARALGADLLYTSAYKFFGPHLGVAFGRRAVLESLRPYKVRPAHDEAPDRWETGTQNHEALAGLIAAVGYLGSLSGGAAGGRAAVSEGLEAIRRHEDELTERFLEGLEKVERARLYGIREPERADDRTPTFAIRLEGRGPREVSEALAERGIFTWDGNYYALALMERLGLEESGGAVRIGFCHYNTHEEVDRVLAELSELGAHP